MAFKLTHTLLAATLGILMILPAAPAAAQEGKVVGYVLDGRGEIRPVRKLDKSDTPFYSLVRWFYRHILTDYRWGEAAQNESWRALGIKPDSPEANSILKAAFRAEALFLDFAVLPSGSSDKEFNEAQYKGQEGEARELEKITLAMLRELKAGNAPLDLWNAFLEQKIRPTISTTIYGNSKDEYDRKFDKLQEEFESRIRAELDAPGEGTP